MDSENTDPTARLKQHTGLFGGQRNSNTWIRYLLPVITKSERWREKEKENEKVRVRVRGGEHGNGPCSSLNFVMFLLNFVMLLTSSNLYPFR